MTRNHALSALAVALALPACAAEVPTPDTDEWNSAWDELFPKMEEATDGPTLARRCFAPLAVVAKRRRQLARGSSSQRRSPHRATSFR